MLRTGKGRRTSSKRRRIVYLEKMTLFTAAFIFAVCLSVLGSRVADAHGNSQEEPVDYRYYKSIQVNSGDTLWSIAGEYMDEDSESITEYVELLKDINRLDSSEIHEGRYLTVAYTDQEFR